jgi:hypothetical protein
MSGDIGVPYAQHSAHYYTHPSTSHRLGPLDVFIVFVVVVIVAVGKAFGHGLACE